MSFILTHDFQGFANRAIASAVGKSWEPLGRGPEAFDCWGFVRWVYRAGGRPLADYPYLEGDELEGIDHSLWEPAADRAPYSVVALGRGVCTSHVGIYHPNGLYYHCTKDRGVCGDRYEAIRHAFSNVNYWYPNENRAS